VVDLIEVAPEDLMIFVYDRQQNELETSWTDFENELGPWDGSPEHKCAKQTFVNYKSQLEKSGRLQKKIGRTNRPVYYVPDKFKNEAEKLSKKKRVHNYVDEADDNELEHLRIVYELEKSENVQLKKSIDTLVKQVQKNDTFVVKIMEFFEELSRTSDEVSQIKTEEALLDFLRSLKTNLEKLNNSVENVPQK